jgi:ParB/RepB/Spo0J family partition protein
MMIPVEEIVIPATRTKRDYGDMRSFIRSLQEFGQLQPIGVELIGDKFVLIFGGRRLEAFKQLGWENIWAEPEENLTPLQRKEIELEENLARKQFSPMERCKALKELYTAKKEAYECQGDLIGLRYYSQQKFAEEVRIQQSEVSRSIKLAEAAENYPELMEAKSITEAERRLRMILLERKTGISPEMKLEFPEDVTTDILSLQSCRLIYAILSTQDHWMIPELEAKLDCWGTLIVETREVGLHPIFQTKPTIVQETGKENYQELFVLSRGKSNPLGERVITVERSYDFHHPHSHSRIFWEKILKATMLDVQNKNLILINPMDLSMGEFCFSSAFAVRYLFTDHVLYQQLKQKQEVRP